MTLHSYCFTFADNKPMGMNHDFYLIRENFKNIINKKETDLFLLTNSNGMEVWITNYGGRVVAMRVPHRGELIDVVLGFDSLQKYLVADEQYHGAIVGRFANRIANGKYKIGTKEYSAPINNGTNSLHGGINGFHSTVWRVHFHQQNALVLSHHSPDGDQGYPGNLNANCYYTLLDDNTLKIELDATTDQPTIINLTHHNYFNLKGEGSGTVMDHKLKLHTDSFVPLSEECVPIGTIENVDENPIFDYRAYKELGQDIAKEDQQLTNAAGYDHTYVVNGYEAGKREVQLAAEAVSPDGLKLSILTNTPGIHLYTGNFLGGINVGKAGEIYNKREAFCLEQQHYPDSPNHPNFPSTVLNPGEQYYNVCLQKFESV